MKADQFEYLVSDNSIHSQYDGYWIHFYNDNVEEDLTDAELQKSAHENLDMYIHKVIPKNEYLDRMQKLKSVYTHGKYMFFSDDLVKLAHVTQCIMVKYKLHHAKLSAKCKNSPGFGHVSCIYDTNDSKKYMLKQYASYNVNYRYWKYDIDTLCGIYSDAHRNSSRTK